MFWSLHHLTRSICSFALIKLAQ